MEGLTSAKYQKATVAVLICCLLVISIDSTLLSGNHKAMIAGRPEPYAFISQYVQSDSLNFSSDDEFITWANLNGFDGDGSYYYPFYITGLDVTGISVPSLKLSNITNTHFIFDDCIFRSYEWYGAIDLSNMSSGVFTNCFVYGAVLLNDTAYCDIVESYIYEGVYIDDTIDSVFASNWFDVGDVYVISIHITSTNVSFYDNIFLGELSLIYCTDCYIVENSFYASVHDDGITNVWDSNRYSDYNGVGVYLIPGVAGSIDSNPGILSSETPTTWFPGWTSSPLPTSGNGDFNSTIPFDFFLLGAISFEIGVVVMILLMRRKPDQ
ncbi:MAG: hypothetical protein ACFFEA_08300 [Candidatus Thorarchaeota archaeon]